MLFDNADFKSRTTRVRCVLKQDELRKYALLEYLKRCPGKYTNTTLAAAVGWSYRAVQSATYRLMLDGLIEGRTSARIGGAIEWSLK